MKRILIIAILILTSNFAFAGKVLTVVTSTTDFADLAKAVGGDLVNVQSLTKGNADLHSIEPRPSMVMSVRNADLVIRIGMDLDMWALSLIDASKNSRVLVGGPGNLDASERIEKMEVPVGKVDMGMGDVHIYGNPHYWTDPENGIIVAGEIRDRLSQMVPDSKDYFASNCDALVARISNAMLQSEELLKPYAGTKIVTYHRSLPYFAKRFGLVVLDTLEPKPAVPPTPSHLLELEAKIKTEHAKIILQEPWFSMDAANSVSRNTGIKVLVIASSVGGLPEIKHYEDIFLYDAAKLAELLK
jgi:ABC-type Zn uptake system ZnuABC Zn-binding protein ZnuA